MKLSIILFTYNHAPFIQKAIDSVLMQQTSFAYEVIVADDASTDGTQDILHSYANKHPGIFRLFLNDVNNGMLKQFLDSLKRASGEYVALLDGDDYWTEPTKVETQVAFLDDHPEFALCAHNAMVRNEWTNTELVFREMPSDVTLSMTELIARNSIPTASMVFRNGLIGEWPACFLDLGFGDWALQIVLAEKGSVRHLHKPMSVYRIHSGGAWSRYRIPSDKPRPDTTAEGWVLVIRFWEILMKYLNHRHDDQILQLIERKRQEITP